MKPARLAIALAALVGALLGSGREAAAWGPAAHRLIAVFADHVLQQSDPAARAKLMALLATDKSNTWTKTDIASESTWADVLREKSAEGRAATSAWHYVKLKPDAPDLKQACFDEPGLAPEMPASHGPQNDCSVDKIAQFTKELRDPATLPGERLMALQFLLNLVADLHDPLDAIDRGDQGGRCTAIAVGHDKKPARLVTYWDVTLAGEVAGKDPQLGAVHVAGGVAPADVKKWVVGTPGEWALETVEVAKTAVYAFPKGEAPTKYAFPAAKGETESCGSVQLYRVGPEYETRGLAAVKLQLARAGVRLAAVLRDSFK